MSKTKCKTTLVCAGMVKQQKEFCVMFQYGSHEVYNLERMLLIRGIETEVWEDIFYVNLYTKEDYLKMLYIVKLLTFPISKKAVKECNCYFGIDT